MIIEYILLSRGRSRCTVFGYILKFSRGPFLNEFLYIWNLNQAVFSFELFSWCAFKKPKIKTNLHFFLIYFKARVMRAGLNVALTMLFNIWIEIHYFNFFLLIAKISIFKMSISNFSSPQNLLLIAEWKFNMVVGHVQGALI